MAIFSIFRMRTALEIMPRGRKFNQKFVKGIVLPGLGKEKGQLTPRNLGDFSRHKRMP
jgi:hypothetical protein